MGILLEKGVSSLNIAPRIEAAIDCYKKAAAQGSLEAQDRLNKEGPFMLKKSGKYEEVLAEEEEDYHREIIVKAVEKPATESFKEALTLEARLIKWKVVLENVEAKEESKK